VEKVLNSTGPQFRKYLARALASRAAEDEERKISVAQTLSRTSILHSHLDAGS
jgi:cytoskeleton-associated protein 5